MLATLALDVQTCSAAQPSAFEWQRLPNLPDSLGVAGAFVGVTDGAVLVAGGANFPDGPPWRGGQKSCLAAIHLLVQRPQPHWTTLPKSLPHALAYGVSVTTDRGVLVIGGCDTTRCYQEVQRLSYSEQGGVEIENLPPLPRPLAYMAGAGVGRLVFVAGGQESVASPVATAHFYALDLSKEGSPDFGWRQLPDVPGPARVVPVACAAGRGSEAAFYLFSGRTVSAGEIPRSLADAHRYDAVAGRWEPLPEVAIEDAAPRCVMAGAAVAEPPNSILLLGGDDGGTFLALERLRGQIAVAGPTEKLRLTERLNDLLNRHPGFSRDMIRFDIATRRYSLAGVLPASPPVTTVCVPWQGGFVLPSGEVRPGVRSPGVWFVRKSTEK